MRIGLGIGIGLRKRVGISVTVDITGLTSGAAQIGTHASIGATMSDASAITAYKWGSAPGGTQYGTGAAPTDFTAGDGGSLYLTATTAAGNFTDSAEIRYAAGTAPAIADGQAWTVDDTSVSIDASASGTGLTWSYVLTGSTAGVTINAGSGLISGTPTSVASGTATVTATDQYGREVSDTFTWTSALRTQATGGADLDLTFPEDSAISSTDLKANWTLNGNTLTYAITGTALPTGLSVSSAGLMTGTPTTATADATYTLRGTDEYGRTTDDTFTLEITEVDTTAPTLSSITWDDPTDTATFTSDEAGTLIVATHVAANTVTPNGSGGWTGTTIETDSVAISSGGPTNYVVEYTDASASADRVSYYVRDAAGNDSAVQTETFTPVVASTAMRYMVAGAPTTDSLRVAIGTVAGAADVKLAYSTASNMAGHTTTAAISTNTAVLAATFDAPALTADTTYYYQAKIDGVRTGPIQSARTLPDHTGSVKIAFASCAERNVSPVWGHIASRTPDLFIGLGDFPYIDENVNDEQVFRTKLQAFYSADYDFNDMAAVCPVDYTWDDHDYAVNANADTNSTSKPAVQAVYRQLFPHYPLEVAGSIYHAYNLGPIRTIVMDLRSEREDGSPNILLSTTQMAWVKSEILAARDDANIKMVVLASGSPWIGTVSEGWYDASAQRIELNDYILDAGMEKRTLLINGDAHMLAFDNGTNNTFNTGARPSFRVACSAPLNRTASTKSGTYSTPGIITSNNQFTVMDAVPDGLGELDVTITGISANAQAYQVTFTTADGAYAIAAPTSLNLSANTIAEDANAGDVVGTLSSNGGGALTYTLTSDPSGNFEVVGSQLRVASGATLVETNTHNITVQVSNLNGSHSENFTITVTAAASGAGQVVQYKQGSTAFGTSSAVTLDTAPTSGNLLVIYCTIDKSQVSLTPPAGFTVVDSHLGVTEIGGVLCYKVSDGTETGAITTSWTSSTRWGRTAIVELQGPIGTAPIVLSKGAVKTEAIVNSVSITGDASVTVDAVAVAFYSNDSRSGVGANYTYTGGFAEIPGTATYKGTGDTSAPVLIGGYKIITATETPSLSIGHDGTTDGSIGFMAAFKTA